MATPFAQLPAEDSPAGVFARGLAVLLGPAFQATPGGPVEALLLGLGDGLAAAHATNTGALDEALADSATALLAEWERMYGLPTRPDLTTAARRDRLVAAVRAARAGTPQDVLTAVRRLDPTATIVETTAAAVALTNPRNVFRFVVVLAAAVWADTELRAAIERLVDRMKPAHTGFGTTVTAVFKCDDSDSLCDRDVLGS